MRCHALEYVTVFGPESYKSKITQLTVILMNCPKKNVQRTTGDKRT